MDLVRKYKTMPNIRYRHHTYKLVKRLKPGFESNIVTGPQLKEGILLPWARPRVQSSLGGKR